MLDFMSILREAKDPITKIEVGTDDTDESTDYSESVDTDDVDDTMTDEETDDTTEDDTTDEESEDTTDDEDTEDTEDTGEDEDLPTDYSETVDEIQPTDDGGIGEETPTDDTMSEDEASEEDPDEKHKKNILLSDFVQLYAHINNTLTKFDSIKSLDMLTRAVINKAKENMTTLAHYTHTYTSEIYKTKTYTENLYTYKYIVQLYKICVQMLGEINEFNTDT